VVRKREYHPKEYAEYLDKHYRHNIVVNILDIGFFQFSMSLVSAGIILPAFALRLDASNMVIGFLPALMRIGWLLPQLFVSYFIEGLLRKKPMVLFMGIFQRLPWFLLGLFTLQFAIGSPRTLLILFIIFLSITTFAGGINATAWGDMIAKAIPRRLRGRFMGYVNLIGNALAVFGGLTVKFIMESGRFAYPANYALLFFGAFFLLAVSFYFFYLNREPILLPSPREKSFAEYFRNIPLILKKDHNFFLFICARILGLSNVMGLAFFMTYSMKRFGLNDAVTGNFVLISTIATMAASPILGLVADRKGHKNNLIISRLLYIIAVLIAMTARQWQMMYLVFVFIAMNISANMISMNNIVFEFAPEGRRPTYMGLAATLSAPFILLFSFLGGKLAGSSVFGLYLPFLVSMLFNIVSMIILAVWVKEPKKG